MRRSHPSPPQCQPEHGIPDFISFMPALRARNPVFWPKMGIQSLRKFMLPKRRCSNPEKHFGPSFWALFQGCLGTRFWLRLLEKCSKRRSEMFFGFRKSSFEEHKIHAHQTKILESWTKYEMRIFRWLFNCSWPKTCTHTIEKHLENPHLIFCSAFQNLRLVSIRFASGLNQPVASRVLFASDPPFPKSTRILKREIRMKFMLPKRRFSKPETHFGPSFWALFQGCEY